MKGQGFVAVLMRSSLGPCSTAAAAAAASGWLLLLLFWLTVGSCRTTVGVDWSSTEWDLSRKLYAILTSYLKGSALHLSKAGVEDRNGFVLWKRQRNRTTHHQHTFAQTMRLFVGGLPWYVSHESLREWCWSFRCPPFGVQAVRKHADAAKVAAYLTYKTNKWL